MPKIAWWRVNLLRLAYLFLILGLGLAIWPAILDPATSWSADRGVVVAMLASLSLLALVGLRHPVRMLPLLFWELVWKAVWLIRIALPAWWHGRLDAAMAETASECTLAVLIALVIPWDLVVRSFITGAGEPWTRGAAIGSGANGRVRA